MENTKQIINHSNYSISIEGKIKNTITNKELVNVLNHNGYLIIKLNTKDNIKILRVHRLVAEAFIPNPDNYPQVNHKDGK